MWTMEVEVGAARSPLLEEEEEREEEEEDEAKGISHHSVVVLGV